MAGPAGCRAGASARPGMSAPLREMRTEAADPSAKPPAGASYGLALKTLSITGSASLIEVLLRAVKSKVIAVVLGPAGIGLFGVLTAAVSLICAIVGMGLNGSGVRQVAAAGSKDDLLRVTRVVLTLRRTSLLLGLLGTALVALFARPIARISAGSEEYAGFLLVLAPLVLLTSVKQGQEALLRGLRQVAALARLRVAAALVGTIVTIPLVLQWGLKGIPPAMLLGGVVANIASWWYARKIKLIPMSLAPGDFVREATALFSLGLVFLVTGLQAPSLQYGLRSILLHHNDLNVVGQFLAASTLSHIYVTFILDAMGMDYLPRLTRASEDVTASNRLVNEQTEVAMLVAGPGVVGAVVLAPVLIPLLYSGRFTDAIEVFRWQCLGVLLKVAVWPMGFLLVARGRRFAFLATETLGNAFYIAVFLVLAKYSGLMGAALSYALFYAAFLLMVLAVVRRHAPFTWSTEARRAILATMMAYTLTLACREWIPAAGGIVASAIVLLSYAAWAYRQLCLKAGVSLMRAAVDALLQRIRRSGRGGQQNRP